MRSTFKILTYINRNKIKADGTTAVLCRITIDGKSTAMTTGIYVAPDNWNADKGEIIGSVKQKIISFLSLLPCMNLTLEYHPTVSKVILHTNQVLTPPCFFYDGRSDVLKLYIFFG